ncbi:type I restriction-modification system subunit M [Aquiflexum sp. LQ15W]|uniref:type I restriction-modification system subunit M n=1 Tax=Cognataquiflexum nitidum TaxID=2922272 RepID=UPI001F136518|nr:type I restriction-modification system subunit M [Cognataquiflexum nitidum]MCH6201315.1 type I restriction-modification system subunit M [Cognataquiflexum nitidum]
MLQNNAQLKSLIDKLWQNFWEGGIANPLTAIEQITYLIFMKRLDDLEAKRERDAEFTGETYTSRFKGTFKTPGSDQSIDKNELRWSVFKHKPAEEMLMHVQMKVFPFLKAYNQRPEPSADESSKMSIAAEPIEPYGDKKAVNESQETSEIKNTDNFTRHMANAVFIMPKASLLVSAINIVEDIFKEIEKDATEGGHAFQDIQGDVYEMLLSEIASAGKNGQFRTPRHLIKLMAELVAPQFGQTMADPSSGTGGFILGYFQYILTDLVRKTNPELLTKDEDGFERASISAILTEDLKKILAKSMYGYDIDTTMVRLGIMNLMMHGIDNPQLDYKDTLSKSYNEDSRYDIIMANPPFTGNIDKGDINEGLKLPTTKTELLFVERIFNMLKMGGTAAVIVPSGVIQNSGKAFEAVRKLIIEQAELKAVIAVPSGAFKPYAGVSTAILIFTKGGETNNVWFYDMQADGYTLDDKRNKIAESDLPDIVQRYKARDVKIDSDRKQKYFMVSKKEIVKNNYDLNLSTYKEEVYEEIIYDKPTLILNKLSEIEKAINSGIIELTELSK